MNCPRCPGSVLDEREREGITIDVCPACRGVWLDRGELERLQARAVAEIEAAVRGTPAAGAAPPPAPSGVGAAPWRRRDDDDDDDDDDRRERDSRGAARHEGNPRGAQPGAPPPRKRRWLEMFDIFD